MKPAEQIRQAEASLRRALAEIALKFAVDTGCCLSEIRVEFMDCGTNSDPYKSLIGDIHVEYRIR